MLSEYSITSNTVKLLKHLDTLKGLQRGYATPIMVHVMPTHRCQLKCIHCCFKNREDLTLDMDLGVFKDTIHLFSLLGTHAIEFTGGGDPTLYPQIQDCLSYAINLNFKIGFITNGLEIKRIKDYLPFLSWIRISLNTLDYGYSLKSQMKILQQSGVPISFCYIWNDNSGKNINKIAKFSAKYEIACRIAPDCIQTFESINWDLNRIGNVLNDTKNNEFLFLSQVNTNFRINGDCYIHLIKPAFYTDGYIYPCPSAELALENNHQINEDFRLCHGKDVFAFYRKQNLNMKLSHDCSFCKYRDQQDFLRDVLTETQFNEFA